jgi:hypothetical protein
MIEISWALAKSPLFKQAYTKLIHADHGQKINYSLMRMSNLFDQEGKIFDQAFMSLLKKYDAVKPDGSYSLQSVPDDKKDAYMKEMEELHAQKFTINKNKININDLKCSLTAAEMLALEPLLFGLDIIEGGTDGEQNKNQEVQA